MEKKNYRRDGGEAKPRSKGNPTAAKGRGRSPKGDPREAERPRRYKETPAAAKGRGGSAQGEPTATESQKHVEGCMRLNKYIAHAGICSRREADRLIAAGSVSVNGKVITEMGYQVRPGDVVNYGGETLRSEALRYFLLNKPKGFITTVDDPQERQTVMMLIDGACPERIYPVGRLDRATTGLLLFTNDGDMAKKLTHPSSNIYKIYHVELDKPLAREDMRRMMEGITLDDGRVFADA